MIRSRQAIGRCIWGVFGGLTLMVAALATGCAAPERPYTWVHDLPGVSRINGDAVIHPRDTIAVVVTNQPALSGEFIVHDDGTYLQPTLGNIGVVDQLPDKVAAVLQERLKDMIVNARVTVSLVRVAPIRVSVVGEVKAPGAYELNRDRTLAGALAAAGWLTDFAAKDRVFVLENGKPQQARIRFSVREVTSPDSGSAWFRLHDGDVVVVE